MISTFDQRQGRLLNNASSRALYDQHSLGGESSNSPGAARRRKLKKFILLNSKTPEARRLQDHIYVNENFEEVDIIEDPEMSSEELKRKRKLSFSNTIV